jgi:hypothetical protein
VFPRVAGMLMSGLGLSIFGMIRARSQQQYPATLLIRTYFIICIVGFYLMPSDPFFLALIAIVGLGFVPTWRTLRANGNNAQATLRHLGAGEVWGPHYQPDFGRLSGHRIAADYTDLKAMSDDVDLGLPYKARDG